jgi:hypothetical protein
LAASIHLFAQFERVDVQARAGGLEDEQGGVHQGRADAVAVRDSDKGQGWAHGVFSVGAAGWAAHTLFENQTISKNRLSFSYPLIFIDE